jgi:hypothetical protein
MNRLEILQMNYGIEKGNNLSFSKGPLTIQFYTDHSCIDLDRIKPAINFSDEINCIHIFYINNHLRYFEEIWDTDKNTSFILHQNNEEETILSIENILLQFFLNQDEYRIKAENEWIIKQIDQNHYFCLGAILDTTYNPNKRNKKFLGARSLKKEKFKVYEVHHIYSNYNEKKDSRTKSEENYFIIKYDNHLVSDLYINQFIPKARILNFYATGEDKLEIKINEILTMEFQNKYDQYEHYSFFLNPISSILTESYKAQIREIYKQQNNNDHFRQAEAVISNYQQLCPTNIELVDMFFYLIEIAIDYNKDISVINKVKIFTEYLRPFQSALKIISENKLLTLYDERIKIIIQDGNEVIENFNQLFIEYYYNICKETP